MKALGDAVFVKPHSTEQTRDSGLVIPDAAQEKATQGVVVAAGPKAPVTSGVTVLFSRYAGQEIEVDGENLLMMKAHDLLAVLDV